MLNLADALLVCEDTKTLAALQRPFVEAPDPSNRADFLRISTWQAREARGVLRQRQVERLLSESAPPCQPAGRRASGIWLTLLLF